MFHRFSILALLLFFANCSETPEPDKKVAHLYVDILKAEETFYIGLDSLQIVRDSLFRKYNISEEEYKAELKNYSSDSEVWKKFYEMSMTYIDSIATNSEN